MTAAGDSAAPARCRYRLQELAGELPASFLLEAGAHRLGSAPTNDIVLSRPGVSRRHALLVVTAEQVTIDDLASKNGVQINGQRAVSAPLRPGDVVEIGEVLLRLEEVSSAATELAIHLASEGRRSAPVWTSADTPFLASREAPAAAAGILELIERFAGRVASAEGLAAALVGLLVEMRLSAAAVLEATPSETVVVASAGPLTSLERIESLLREAAADAEALRVVSDSHILPAVSLVVVPGRASILALVVWGRPLASAIDERVLKTLGRVVELARRQPGEGVAVRDAAAVELIFPADYVGGSSSEILHLHRLMAAVCATDLPLLILGETGVGKELVARTLHVSSRRRGPFVAINCAAIPAELLEAELFGISGGVATGVTARQGKFRQADGGTLFLDEIGDVPVALQAKLLRTLQEREVHPVGAGPVAVDVRILAATNIDLGARIERGSFRADLYYRLSGAVLEVPPLRRRREDIPGFIEHFLRRFGEAARRQIRGVTVAALQELIAYDWPGNVRELEHEVQKLVLLCPPRQAIDIHLLPAGLRTDGTPTTGASAEPAVTTAELCDLEELEKRHVAAALAQTGGNQVQAAELLGISRYALRRRIARHGLAETSQRRSPED